IALLARPLVASESAAVPSGLDVTVLDPQGFVLPGATVTIVEARRSVTTDATGMGRVTDLDPGTYTVQVDVPGMTPVTPGNVRVVAGRTSAIALAFETLRSRETQIDVVGQEDATRSEERRAGKGGRSGC